MAIAVSSVSIKQRLGQTRPLLCSWLMMPGEFQAGVYAGSGLNSGIDSVLIDMQHGMAGYRDMVAMVQAVNATGAYAIVRPPLEGFGMVPRALDVGASGIICPMINNAEDARHLVAAAKFPPIGSRSWGAYLGQSQMGLSKEEYLANANDLNAVFAMVETREALDNLDEICAVDGLDGIYVGPNDLCISLTNGKAGDVNHPDVQAVLPEIVAAARRAGIFAGIYTSNLDDVKKYQSLGFSLMTALTDVAFMNQGVAQIGGRLGE